jgi:DNA end-binding protein Ku
MARRPYWTGQLRLSLVSIPVELYPAASSSARIGFHQIDRKSGKRIRHEKVVPGVGPVDRDEILKGCEYAKASYVVRCLRVQGPLCGGGRRRGR